MVRLWPVVDKGVDQDVVSDQINCSSALRQQIRSTVLCEQPEAQHCRAMEKIASCCTLSRLVLGSARPLIHSLAVPLIFLAPVTNQSHIALSCTVRTVLLLAVDKLLTRCTLMC